MRLQFVSFARAKREMSPRLTLLVLALFSASVAQADPRIAVIDAITNTSPGTTDIGGVKTFNPLGGSTGSFVTAPNGAGGRDGALFAMAAGRFDNTSDQQLALLGNFVDEGPSPGAGRAIASNLT